MKFSLFGARKEVGPYLRYHAKARLYEYEGSLFVCSVADIAETDSLTTLTPDTDDFALGEAVLRHLAEFTPTDGRDLRSMKASDWAAYRASGARSIKTFEPRLWHVDLAVMNSAVLIHARPRLSLRTELSVCCGASKTLPEQVGAGVRAAIAAAKALREQGVV